ncbi:MAG: ABC transporter substrate-binding protein [Phycisphaerae bacterium]
MDTVKRIRTSHHSRAFLQLSPGAWIILAIALLSSAVILFDPTPHREGLDMWTFAPHHAAMYRPLLAEWNRTHQVPVNLYVISEDAMADRLMSGFLSHTPVADLIEVEKALTGRIFSGPLDDIGLVDLTDRVKHDHLLEELNAPSFSAWTSRGHIFGLPHDVHPVLLAYRADLVEAAGIDVTQIHTWDDFARIMQPLLQHRGPDGQPDHYPLSLWYTSMDQIEALILQNNGGFFDEDNRPILNSDENARVIATVVSWTTGPTRIAADAPEFTASGNQLRITGYVACSLVPDWLTAIWKHDMPQLSGKLKLMPLPAWTADGRRTSVWGGTMLGISKTCKEPEAAWLVARRLYLDDSVAKELFESNGIITPVKRLWSSPFYDQPDPYFSNEPIGRIYINHAPAVPRRTSSPYNSIARDRVQSAIIALRNYALATHQYKPSQLLEEAHRQLQRAQTQMQHDLDRDVFLQSLGTKKEPQ